MNKRYFLKSAHIGFRNWTIDDFEIAQQLWQDEEATMYIGGPLPVGGISARLRTEIRIFRLYNIQYWPIFLLNTNEHIGCCGLHPYKPDRNVYEIDCIIKASYQCKGYEKEALTAVIKHAFSTLKAIQLVASRHPENEVAQKLLGKLKFEYTHDEYYAPTRLSHPSYTLWK